MKINEEVMGAEPNPLARINAGNVHVYKLQVS